MPVTIEETPAEPISQSPRPNASAIEPMQHEEDRRRAATTNPATAGVSRLAVWTTSATASSFSILIRLRTSADGAVDERAEALVAGQGCGVTRMESDIKSSWARRAVRRVLSIILGYPGRQLVTPHFNLGISPLPCRGRLA